jgi:hypothetical protein
MARPFLGTGRKIPQLPGDPPHAFGPAAGPLPGRCGFLEPPGGLVFAQAEAAPMQPQVKRDAHA